MLRANGRRFFAARDPLKKSSRETAYPLLIDAEALECD
jgi:hypothetical protein